MYYITSRPSTDDKFALLDISESRTNARAFAKDVGGTVRTEAEYTALVAEHGQPKMTKTVAARMAKHAPVTSVETPLIDNSQAPIFAPGEAEAIASAVGKAMPAIVAKIQERKAAQYMAYNHNGTDLMPQAGTQAAAKRELKEYEAATGNTGGYVAVVTVTTPGKPRKAAKAKATPAPVGKRIYTDESVIKEAKAAYAKAFDNIGSKVNHVRWVAGWASAQGVRLQRRDAFVVLAETDVAAATINTQWQLVRSGKL